MPCARSTTPTLEADSGRRSGPLRGLATLAVIGGPERQLRRMKDDERQELRALLLEVIGAACNSVQSQLGAQISEVHDAIGALGDRLDVIEADVSATRRQLARVLRERETDRDAIKRLATRVAEIQREGEALAKRVAQLQSQQGSGA